MSDDRKYRQHGYQDRDRDRERPTGTPQGPRPNKDMTYGPRAIQMAPTRTVSRCAQCGVVLNAMVDAAGKCPQCGAALRTCKQCTHFDPACRFECRQHVPERIVRKDAANTCTSFTLSTRVERQTSSSGSRADDARRAFENLFKK